jgi:uncharacterized membrane protein YcaP (DUF421 family)
MPDLSFLHDLIGRDGHDPVWWQMCARGVIVFIFGLGLVRAAGKRLFGKWGAMDIILSVIIGSNLSRSITGNSPFLPTLAATALLVALHAVLARMAVSIPALGPVLKGHPARLIEHGQVDHAAMRRHGVGHHDLEQALRCSGLTSPKGVAAAYLERNGEISVLKEDG